MRKHGFSWFNHEKVTRPETRVDPNISCSKCGSAHVVKDNHRCGRAVCASDCEAKFHGCSDMVSSKQFIQRYKCLDCQNGWSVISSM